MFDKEKLQIEEHAMSDRFPLVRRFQYWRWSETRKAIHALEVWDKAVFPESQRNNAVTSVQRLSEAYNYTRIFKVNTLPNRQLSVTRTK